MGKGLASFAVGFGGGYLKAQRQNDLDKERQEDRAMRKQDHDARMDEVSQAKNLRISLADAARPVSVEQGAGGMVKPDTMDNRDVGLPENDNLPNGGLSLGGYLVKGKAYGSQTEAAAAAKAENSPDAVALRQGAAYRQAGRPSEALEIEQKQAQITGAQMAQARKLKEEGVFEAVRALRAGDASGVAAAFNNGGQYKLDGMPVISQEERDVPGIGKIPTYGAKIRMIGPDGTPVEKTFNSHDLSMQMMPYEKALELQRKGADSDNKAQYQGALIDAKGAALEARTAAAGAKASAQAGKGGGAPSREERMRYTTLFTDAGRRAGEAQKALSTLQKDPMYARAAPGTPRYEEMQGLRDTLKQHNEERAMYQGLLANSQTQAAPSLANATSSAKVPASPLAIKSISSAAERDALPKGAKYIAPNGQTYVKQ